MEQIDPQVKALTTAIGKQEGGGSLNYDQYGDNKASYGAYQWNNGGKPLNPGELPSNWKADAGRFLGDPNAPMSEENQNKAAYLKIAHWKSQGYTPPQIASMWNAGEGEPDAHTGQFSNGQPSRVPGKFDVPGYTEGVKKYYTEALGEGQQMADGLQTNLTSFGGDLEKAGQVMDGAAQSATSDAQTLQQMGQAQHPQESELGMLGRLGSEFGGLVQKFDPATANAGVVGGLENFAHMGLQGAGLIGQAISGTVGHAYDATVGNLPVLGQFSRDVGQATGGAVSAIKDYLSNTGPGRQLSAIAAEHPELTKDVEGAAQAAMGLAAGEGALGVGKLAAGTAGKLAGGVLERTAPMSPEAVSGLRSVMSSNATGRKILDQLDAKGVDLGSELADKGVTPQIKTVDGVKRFDTIGSGDLTDLKASEANQANIKTAEDTLVSKLDTMKTPGLPTIQWGETGPTAAAEGAKIQVPLDQIKSRVLKAVNEDPAMQFAGTDKDKILSFVNKEFEAHTKNLGDNLSMKDTLKLKRAVLSSKDYQALRMGGRDASVELQARGYIRDALQKTIEDTAAAAGDPTIGALNQEYSKLITIQKMLDHLHGKAIPKQGGMLPSVAKITSDVAGGAVGAGVSSLLGGGVPGEIAGGLIGKQTLAPGIQRLLMPRSPLEKAAGRALKTRDEAAAAYRANFKTKYTPPKMPNEVPSI